MKNIFEVINPLHFSDQYGSVRAYAASMQKLIIENNVKIIIEVGVFAGLSTIWFAEHIPTDGTVIAVDTFSGSIEHQKGGEKEERNLDTLYQQFLSNMIHKKVQNKVIPIRMTSIEASRSLIKKPDLFFLDASHDEESVYNDLHAWWPLIESGVICGDDYTWQAKSPFLFPTKEDFTPQQRSTEILESDKKYEVRMAVKRFAQEKNLKLYSHMALWWYEKN